MTIPENFELAPVKTEANPAAVPPRCRKNELYNSLDVETVDNHAIEEARTNYSNFRDLIWNLVFNQDLTQLEKTRVIFRWMTCKDMTSFEFDSESPSVPERLLTAFKSGTGSYARTFEYLARYAGLPCVSISGWAKGADYRPGDLITAGPPNHSWNAVYINENWHLVDCHWATRYLRLEGENSSTDSESKVGSDFDDFYFLTDPEEMIFSHKPIEDKWQLLENKWSSDDFDQRPYIKSQFFSLGLQVTPENSGVVHAEAGLATLSLSFASKIAFTYRFRYEDGTEGIRNLSRYVLQEMTDQRLNYFVRTPLPGTYILTVFAREFLDDITPKSMITFKSVAEYKLVNDEEGNSGDLIAPFPYCSDSSWGLDMYASFSSRRLYPEHRMAVLFCPEGCGEIKINRNGSKMKLYARLVREGIAFDVLKSCVTIEESDDVAVVKVDLPELGEFGLEVFVNDAYKDGKLFCHFCQYLCTTETSGRFTEAYLSIRDPVEEAERNSDADNTSLDEAAAAAAEPVEEVMEAVSESQVCSGIDVIEEAKELVDGVSVDKKCLEIQVVDDLNETVESVMEQDKQDGLEITSAEDESKFTEKTESSCDQGVEIQVEEDIQEIDNSDEQNAEKDDEVDAVECEKCVDSESHEDEEENKNLVSIKVTENAPTDDDAIEVSNLEKETESAHKDAIEDREQSEIETQPLILVEAVTENTSMNVDKDEENVSLVEDTDNEIRTKGPEEDLATADIVEDDVNVEVNAEEQDVEENADKELKQDETNKIQHEFQQNLNEALNNEDNEVPFSDKDIQPEDSSKLFEGEASSHDNYEDVQEHSNEHDDDDHHVINEDEKKGGIPFEEKAETEEREEVDEVVEESREIKNFSQPANLEINNDIEFKATAEEDNEEIDEIPDHAENVKSSPDLGEQHDVVTDSHKEADQDNLGELQEDQNVATQTEDKDLKVNDEVVQSEIDELCDVRSEDQIVENAPEQGALNEDGSPLDVVNASTDHDKESTGESPLDQVQEHLDDTDGVEHDEMDSKKQEVKEHEEEEFGAALGEVNVPDTYEVPLKEDEKQKQDTTVLKSDGASEHLENIEDVPQTNVTIDKSNAGESEKVEVEQQGEDVTKQENKDTDLECQKDADEATSELHEELNIADGKEQEVIEHEDNEVETTLEQSNMLDTSDVMLKEDNVQGKHPAVEDVAVSDEPEHLENIENTPQDDETIDNSNNEGSENDEERLNEDAAKHDDRPAVLVCQKEADNAAAELPEKHDKLVEEKQEVHELEDTEFTTALEDSSIPDSSDVALKEVEKQNRETVLEGICDESNEHSETIESAPHKNETVDKSNFEESEIVESEVQNVVIIKQQEEPTDLQCQKEAHEASSKLLDKHDEIDGEKHEGEEHEDNEVDAALGEPNVLKSSGIALKEQDEEPVLEGIDVSDELLKNIENIENVEDSAQENEQVESSNNEEDEHIEDDIKDEVITKQKEEPTYLKFQKEADAELPDKCDDTDGGKQKVENHEDNQVYAALAESNVPKSSHITLKEDEQQEEKPAMEDAGEIDEFSQCLESVETSSQKDKHVENSNTEKDEHAAETEVITKQEGESTYLECQTSEVSDKNNESERETQEVKEHEDEEVDAAIKQSNMLKTCDVALQEDEEQDEKPVLERVGMSDESSEHLENKDDASQDYETVANSNNEEGVKVEVEEQDENVTKQEKEATDFEYPEEADKVSSELSSKHHETGEKNQKQEVEEHEENEVNAVHEESNVPKRSDIGQKEDKEQDKKHVLESNNVSDDLPEHLKNVEDVSEDIEIEESEKVAVEQLEVITKQEKEPTYLEYSKEATSKLSDKHKESDGLKHDMREQEDKDVDSTLAESNVTKSSNVTLNEDEEQHREALLESDDVSNESPEQLENIEDAPQDIETTENVNTEDGKNAEEEKQDENVTKQEGENTGLELQEEADGEDTELYDEHINIAAAKQKVEEHEDEEAEADAATEESNVLKHCDVELKEDEEQDKERVLEGNDVSDVSHEHFKTTEDASQDNATVENADTEEGEGLDVEQEDLMKNEEGEGHLEENMQDREKERAGAHCDNRIETEQCTEEEKGLKVPSPVDVKEVDDVARESSGELLEDNLFDRNSVESQPCNYDQTVGYQLEAKVEELIVLADEERAEADDHTDNDKLPISCDLVEQRQIDIVVREHEEEHIDVPCVETKTQEHEAQEIVEENVLELQQLQEYNDLSKEDDAAAAKLIDVEITNELSEDQPNEVQDGIKNTDLTRKNETKSTSEVRDELLERPSEEKVDEEEQESVKESNVEQVDDKAVSGDNKEDTTEDMLVVTVWKTSCSEKLDSLMSTLDAVDTFGDDHLEQLNDDSGVERNTEIVDEGSPNNLIDSDLKQEEEQHHADLDVGVVTVDDDVTNLNQRVIDADREEEVSENMELMTVEKAYSEKIDSLFEALDSPIADEKDQLVECAAVDDFDIVNNDKLPDEKIPEAGDANTASDVKEVTDDSGNNEGDQLEVEQGQPEEVDELEKNKKPKQDEERDAADQDISSDNFETLQEDSVEASNKHDGGIVNDNKLDEVTGNNNLMTENLVEESVAESNVQPPEDFHLERIRDKLSSDVKISLKEATNKPFDDLAVFADIDKHASEVSKQAHTSYRNLVWKLVHAERLDSDLKKARALFVYLCSKDLSEVSVDDVDEDSPAKLLVDLQHRETTYAHVFETFCSYLGLHCETVNGYAKGADHRPGMHFEGTEGQHSWNVVLIEGTWRLVDCHWAARRLVGKQVSTENVRYELDEYYFMSDPRQLIFTHFPLESRWQLLESPITLEEFEDLVPVKSTFFKHNLELVSHRNAVIEFEQEQTIIFGCPQVEGDSQLVFTFTLTSDELGDTFEGVDLNQFGMQHIIGDCQSHFHIRPPQTATYQLVIYVKEQQNTEAPFAGVCEYQLICKGSNPQVVPYPPCAHTTWGRGDSAALYPLTPLHGAGAILEVSQNGMVEVQLRMESELRFSARLKSVSLKDEEVLSRYVLTRIAADVAIFVVKVPCVGEFGLEIYANNPQTDGQSLRHVYQYLIRCHQLPESGPCQPFPLLPAGYLGPQSGFKELGLTVSPDAIDPYIIVEKGDLHLSFMTSQLPVRITAQMIDANSDESAEDSSDEYVMQQCIESTISFLVRLPRPGFFKLQIFGALCTPKPADNLPGVYNFLINCLSVETLQSSTKAFPRQYAAWRDGCYLHEPINGYLDRATTHFQVSVPGAISVAAVIGTDWIMFSKDANNDTWSENVQLEKYQKDERKLSICASYDSTTDSYSTLLEYMIPI